MPRATLIGEPWATRTMVFGNRKFVFHGGEPKEVSVAVALVLKRRMDRNKPIFKVDGMPTVVKPNRSPTAEVAKEKPAVPAAIVKGSRQRKLAECLL